MKKHIGIVLLCITALFSVLMITNTYKNKHRANDVILVTGLGKKDFKSDLVIWSGNFEQKGNTLEEASELLNREKEVVRIYLLDKGVKSEQIVFSAMSIRKEYRTTYFENGNIKEQFLKDMF